eukprot:6761966-Pyramimonas_sp.AAC.1
MTASLPLLKVFLAATNMATRILTSTGAMPRSRRCGSSRFERLSWAVPSTVDVRVAIASVGA